MSQTVITTAFEQWKASQTISNESVVLDEFVFALVPGLDPSTPIDRTEEVPPVAQIVHRQAVSRTGVVNENAVVFSVVLGADVGDFSFNWIGLINKASNTLAMVVHAPEQQKIRTAAGQQGNVLTRSFLIEFNGAQAETGINTPAETWQIDFTARMGGMDERQRLENVDIYGAAAFFGDAYLIGKTGTQYFATKGAGYVAGLRSQLSANQSITVSTKPVKVWLDVCWTGSLTSAWAVQSQITVAANLADYVQNGVQHYVFALASIDASGAITDLRPKGALNEQNASDTLKKHEQSRNHPDATTTAKGFTQLSSETNSDSEVLAATPKAVKAVNDNANGRVPSTRKVNGRELSGDIKLTASDVDAVSASLGGTFQKEVYFNGGVTLRSKTGVYSGTDAAGFTSDNLLLKSWYGIGFYCSLDDSGSDVGVTGYINTRIGQLEMKGQIIPGNYSNFDGRFYTKTLADSTFYSVTAANAKFVTGIRLGTQVKSGAIARNIALGAGCVITGLNTTGDFDLNGGDDFVYYRPVQYLINGTYYTSGSV